eukprot:SAG11_NODE_29081_length_314_cov_2.413953_1_plen_72_part_01
MYILALIGTEPDNIEEKLLAASRTPLPPPVSMQVPYQDVSLYTRSLPDGTADFTEHAAWVSQSPTAVLRARL